MDDQYELAAALTELFLAERQSPHTFLAASELALAELLVLPYRNTDDQMIDRYDSWTMSNPYLEIGPLNRQVLWYAAVFRAQHQSLKLPDAIHLSTAIAMNCTHFLSADERLSDRYELFHLRYGVLKGPKAVDVVRPSVQVVRDLIEQVQQQ